MVPSLFSRRSAATRVFPAHAGMVPRTSDDETVMDAFSPPTRGWSLARHRCNKGGRGFLRPRGDGPTVTVGKLPHRTVFPAHAGMVQTGHVFAIRCLCFPRPRGDGPTHPLNALGFDSFSPPTRGWSPAHTQRARPTAVFPAHAGMVPHRSECRGTGRGFPRPRGDGPEAREDIAANMSVFPAHAGMVL